MRQNETVTIIMEGAPGVGKSSLFTKFKEGEGRELYRKIAPGDIIRKEIKKGTELGQKVKEYSNAGQLVPDEIVNKMILPELISSDTINVLDGYPRTLVQAKAMFNAGIYPKMVISLRVPEEEIIRRLSKRRYCSKCGTGFTTMDGNNPPKVEGVCDICEGELTIRNDDKEEIIRERLKVYNSETYPVLEFFKQNNIPVNIIENTSENAYGLFEILMESI